MDMAILLTEFLNSNAEGRRWPLSAVGGQRGPVQSGDDPGSKDGLVGGTCARSGAWALLRTLQGFHNPAASPAVWAPPPGPEAEEPEEACGADSQSRTSASSVASGPEEGAK